MVAKLLRAPCRFSELGSANIDDTQVSGGLVFKSTAIARLSVIDFTLFSHPSFTSLA
jgi:hypothetical protein